VQTFRGKSIRTDDWKAHLFKYFEANGGKEKIDILNSIDFDAWLHGEGLELPVEIEYDTSLAQRAYDLAIKWDSSRKEAVSTLKFSEYDLDGFSSNQIVVFLETLQTLSALPATHIRYMSETYSTFNSTGNAEIRSRWYGLVLASDAAKDFVKDASDWVVGKEKPSKGVKGRMKFCRPIFRSVYKVDPKLAVEYFEENRQYYHPIASKLIAKDLGLST